MIESLVGILRIDIRAKLIPFYIEFTPESRSFLLLLDGCSSNQIKFYNGHKPTHNSWPLKLKELQISNSPQSVQRIHR